MSDCTEFHVTDGLNEIVVCEPTARDAETAIDAMVDEGFLSSGLRDALVTADDPGAMVEAMRAWTATTPKWSKPTESGPRP